MLGETRDLTLALTKLEITDSEDPPVVCRAMGEGAGQRFYRGPRTHTRAHAPPTSNVLLTFTDNFSHDAGSDAASR